MNWLDTVRWRLGIADAENEALGMEMGKNLKIDKDNPFFTIGGKEHCSHEDALIYLLEQEEIFCNSRRYLCPFDGIQPSTTVLFVNCNDVFAWGCADAEPLPVDEIAALYRMVKADPVYGSTKWCCKRRNEKPQPPLQGRMKEDGAWDDELEGLPENYCDVRRMKKQEAESSA